MRTTLNGLHSIPLTDRQRHQLRKAREARGLSQPQLADAVGCATRSIIRLENGPVSPSLKFMGKVCRKLGFTWQAKVSVQLRRKAQPRR